MQETPLWEAWEIRHVTTHRDGSILTKSLAFLLGLGVFTWEVLLWRPRIIHLHMASYGSFFRKAILCWLAKFVNVPVVIHVHGGQFHEFFENSPHFVQACIRSTLHHATVVIALGEVWAERLQVVAPLARIIIVPNSVRPNTLIAQPPQGEPVTLLFLGTVSDAKGAFALLNAWQQVVANVGERRPARLVVAGDGEVARARERVVELGVEDSVTVPGWVNPANVSDLLRAAQVLVLPSRSEGQPMAVLEAMANGLCVVATNVGGIPDLLDSDSGVIVPVDDGEALVRALERVINDDHARTELGAHALERVKDRFDVSSAWKRLDMLYREIQQ